ncbi:MAG: hypothetical protein NT010_06025 [Proteobacteria bacterium]|nr:hypothetical protein [Pseudomonadota bacterium]
MPFIAAITLHNLKSEENCCPDSKDVDGNLSSWYKCTALLQQHAFYMEVCLTKYGEKVTLKTYLDMAYFSLAMSFVEESAKAFGLGAPEVIKLGLACEEIFVYLSESDQKNSAIAIEAENGVYYTGIRFLFDGRNFDPHAFNLTAKISLDSEADLKQMGLIIAARSVERLYILHDTREGFGVGLIKEKSYPGVTEHIDVPVKPLTNYHIASPDSESLKLFVRHTLSHYPSRLFPAGFFYPGKIADMVTSGRYHVLVASDGQEIAAGGIVWQIAGAGMIEIYGPYLFNQPEEFHMAEALVDHLLMAVAKIDAVCLVDVFATPELPKGYFELLGSLEFFLPDGKKQSWPFYYRHHKEDPGSQVWAHPDLLPFLDETYKRLFFARNILQTNYEGEKRPPHAVLFPRFDRSQNLVRLRAVWDGTDFSDILSRHIQIFKTEGILNILFEIDLGHAWQANLAPVLMEHNFVPKMILPYAGAGDMVVFQYAGEV